MLTVATHRPGVPIAIAWTAPGPDATGRRFVDAVDAVWAARAREAGDHSRQAACQR
jgi:hypothetical protein